MELKGKELEEQYLKATAERPDLMGYSNHVVQIFIKN